MAGLAIVVALASSCLGWRSDFFFNDDFATYLMPIMREAARLVDSGHFPLVTDRLWHGGALVAEAQYGLLNPFTFTMAIVVGHLDNLALAASIFSIVHLGVFALGCYALLRVLGCAPSLAMLGAVVAPTSEWILYWGATNWIPFLTSIVWAPWAATAIVKCTARTSWITPAAVGVAMVMTAGSPFTDLALLIVCSTGGVIGIAHGRETWPAVIRAGAAVMLGAMLAAPAIAPLVPYTAISGRGASDVLFRGSVEALLGVSTPFMVTRWQAFEVRPQTVLLPMLAVSWFVTPALTAGNWRALWARPDVRIIAVSALALGMGSLLPSFWQFRWMFRLLPFYQLAMLLLAIVALASRPTWKPVPAMVAAGIPLWIAVAGAPALILFHVPVGALIFALIGLVALMPNRRLSIFLSGHIAFFLLVAAFYCHLPTRYPNDWRPPSQAPRLAEAPLTRYAIFDLPPPGRSGDETYWTVYRPGNISLDRPGSAVNGYSPFYLKAYQRLFCVMHLGGTACPDVVERVSTPILSGRSALDLARIDEVLAQQPWRPAFQRQHPDWTVTELSDGGARFRRTAPFDRPAPIGLAPADSRIGVLSNSPSRIRLAVASTTGGQLVLARAWYPGWSATLDGRSLRVSALRGVFTTVDLPPGSRGMLTVSYWPAGLTAGLSCAGLAAAIVLLLVGFQVFAAYRKDHAQPSVGPSIPK